MAASRGLALLRIGLGLEFALWAWAKTAEGWLRDGEALAHQVEGHLAQAQPTYAELLQAFVLPNVDLFARLVTLGEWAAAATLTFGLFTGVGSLLGMFLMANFMLMRGLVGVDASIDRLFFLACFVCLITPSGQVWSLDRPPRPHSKTMNVWLGPRAAQVHAARPTPLYR